MRKIIPPLLLILCIAMMTALHLLLPLKDLMHYPYNLAGFIFLLAGVALPIWTGRLLIRRNTEIHTFGEPRRLVTDGPFRYSRNPIYLGFVFILTGIWMLMGSLSSLIIVGVFFMITDRWYIKHEERTMERTFGEPYLKYKGNVRRWL